MNKDEKHNKVSFDENGKYWFHPWVTIFGPAPDAIENDTITQHAVDKTPPSPPYQEPQKD